MRIRLSYANITATLALFFAMSGGALAAKHYLINSTNQINPKVLKELKGKGGAAGATGATGAMGATGATGATGAAGKEGPAGSKGEIGPSHAYSRAGGGGTQTVTVPAGNYVVTGLGQFFNGGTKYGAGECEIVAEGKAVATNWSTVPNIGEEELRRAEVSGSMTITDNAAVQLKASGTISEKCQESRESQQAITPSSTEVTAILVGGLN